MNELVERTIDFLEKQSVHREVSPEVPDELPDASDTVFIGSLFFVEKFTHLVEQAVVRDSLKGGTLFINFQSFARVLKREKSFKDIEKLGNSVYVYGADEVETWPFESFKRVAVPPADPLLDSWFIIYTSVDVTYSLVALSRKVAAGSSRARRWKGFWTRRRSVAHYLCDYLVRVVNAQYSAEKAE